MICLPMAANGNRLNAITSCWFGRLRKPPRCTRPGTGRLPPEGKTAIFGKI